MKMQTIKFIRKEIFKIILPLWNSKRLRTFLGLGLILKTAFMVSAFTIHSTGYEDNGIQIVMPGSLRNISYISSNVQVEDITLKVITFNVWGIPLITPHTAERIEAVGQKLADLNPDIVCLQEIWIENDRERLIECLINSRLQYYTYYKSNPFGSGLFILSAYPILEARFQPYTINGKWYKPWHGDWYAGKGIAFARIKLPIGILDVFNTHIISKYDEIDEYQSQRSLQLLELGDFLVRTTNKELPALLLGDFNCHQGDSEYEDAVYRSDLVRLMHVGSSIDNIFAVNNAKYQFETLETVAINDTLLINGKDQRLSDHTGFLSTIRITQRWANSIPALVARVN